MIKFDGLVIKVEPDYKDRIEKGIEIDELWCEVYDERDTEFKHKLGDFNMTQGFEYDEESVESIEKGIKKMVESDWSSYQLEILQPVYERKTEILDKALDYFSEIQKGGELYITLSHQLGMTNEEIKEYGFNTLEAYFEPEEEQGMNLS